MPKNLFFKGFWGSIFEVFAQSKKFVPPSIFTTPLSHSYYIIIIVLRLTTPNWLMFDKKLLASFLASNFFILPKH